MTPWLTVRQGSAALVVSLPHTGTRIPAADEGRLVSLWRARKDTDWWIDRLYALAAPAAATIVHTAISRTIIDVNRDPSGASLYPGQATTGLCPTTTFDGEHLWRDGAAPDAAEIEARRRTYYEPYHAALTAEIARLRAIHPAVLLYDCHSIRSVIPRLFDGVLPAINLGTNDGTSCAPALQSEIERLAAASRFTHVSNGRFKGGFITRSFGRPEAGVHAVQMELACRSYLAEPMPEVDETSWPAAFDRERAAAMQAVLTSILNACLTFVETCR